jgi:hypothetical protein
MSDGSAREWSFCGTLTATDRSGPGGTPPAQRDARASGDHGGWGTDCGMGRGPSEGSRGRTRACSRGRGMNRFREFQLTGAPPQLSCGLTVGNRCGEEIGPDWSRTDCVDQIASAYKSHCCNEMLPRPLLGTDRVDQACPIYKSNRCNEILPRPLPRTGCIDYTCVTRKSHFCNEIRPRPRLRTGCIGYMCVTRKSNCCKEILPRLPDSNRFCRLCLCHT